MASLCIEFKPTTADWLKIVNSVCPLFGEDGSSWYQQLMSDKAQRVCPKHVGRFVEYYLENERLVDVLDEYVAPSSPNFLVKEGDLPEILRPLIAEFHAREKANANASENLTGYMALHVCPVNGKHVHNPDRTKEGCYWASLSKTRQPNASLLADMETWYSQQLAEYFYCAGCCMTPITLAFMSRSRRVYKPAQIIGCPAQVNWASLQGPEFQEFIQKINARIPKQIKLSEFMRQEGLCSSTSMIPDLTEWCRDVLFPEEKAARDQKEWEEYDAWLKKRNETCQQAKTQARQAYLRSDEHRHAPAAQQRHAQLETQRQLLQEQERVAQEALPVDC